MTRLSLATLASSGRTTALSRRGLRPGIVHLGIGAFSRAHTCVFTEDAMAATGDLSWGIVAATQRSRIVADRLSPQDGLFSILERGERAADLRVVGSTLAALSGPDRAEELVSLIGDPGIRVVTLTVTEKGYRLDPVSRRLDLDDPEIRADLAGRMPQTVIGQLARGLQRRARTADGAPLSVVSCDNLPRNGAIVARAVADFVAALPSIEATRIAEFVDNRVTFPSTMVDRMVPATTSADLDEVEHLLGLRDEAAVVAEPYRQWVIEDAFAGERPRWELAGAQLVGDVAPWEAAKLQLLNATHSLLAYLGLAAGMTTIAEAARDDAFVTAARRLMYDDVLPVLDLPAELDGTAYCESILTRVANPALGHTTAKVASDGSQKIGPRLLSTAQAARRAGREPRWVGLAVAAWLWRVSNCSASDLNDPLASELVSRLGSARRPDAVVESLLDYDRVVDPAIAADDGFVGSVRDWYRLLHDHGPEALQRAITR